MNISIDIGMYPLREGFEATQSALLDEENCVFFMKIVTGDRREHGPTY